MHKASCPFASNNVVCKINVWDFQGPAPLSVNGISYASEERRATPAEARLLTVQQRHRTTRQGDGAF